MNEFCKECGFNIAIHREGKCPQPLSGVHKSKLTGVYRYMGAQDIPEITCSECGHTIAEHKYKNCSEINGANATQVGGDHYRVSSIQHWDWAASEDLDYFQGAITKYVARWKRKNGVEDLLKAQHYLQKYIEIQMAKK